MCLCMCAFLLEIFIMSIKHLNENTNISLILAACAIIIGDFEKVIGEEESDPAPYRKPLGN